MSDDVRDPPSYKVGYRKPPVHTRYRKGQTGNRRGRPKTVESDRDMIERIGRELVTAVGEDGKPQRMSRAQAMAVKTMILAAQGDVKAIADLTRIRLLLGDFDPRGRNHQNAGHLVVPKRPETPEEQQLWAIEALAYYRSMPKGEEAEAAFRQSLEKPDPKK